MSNYIELKNVREVNSWIGVEMSTIEQNLRKIMAGTALTIMDFGKRIAPVITGRYRASIHTEYGGDTATGIMGKAMNEDESKFADSPGEGEIFVGTNVVYAGKVEDKHKVMEQAATEGQFYLTRKINELSKK